MREFDAIDALARALPLEVVADLIGFTGHVRANMLRWGQAAMQVIGPMNQRTAESFPIAGELCGWCSSATADDLAPGSVGRGIFEAEARGDIPPGTAGHIIPMPIGESSPSTTARRSPTTASSSPPASRRGGCPTCPRSSPCAASTTPSPCADLGLKAVGHLPVIGRPTYVDGEPGGPALMCWSRDDGSGVAAALDYRIPIPRLRRLSRAPE